MTTTDALANAWHFAKRGNGAGDRAALRMLNGLDVGDLTEVKAGLDAFRKAPGTTDNFFLSTYGYNAVVAEAEERLSKAAAATTAAAA